MKDNENTSPLIPVNPINIVRRLMGRGDSEARVQPYVSVRDLNNGADTNWENEPRPAAEVGIRISF